MGVRAAAAALTAASALSTGAKAQGVASPPPSEEPAVAAAPTNAASNASSSICTDRPTKSNYACTVDPGHFQYEADIVNASFAHQDGVTTDTYFVVNPTVKYGLTSNIDVEATFSPLEVVRTHDGAQDSTLVGVSNLDLRSKYEFLNAWGGKVRATVLPYLKLPTARPGIGNGSVEGGVIAPVNWALNGMLTMTIDPEVDEYKDAKGGGHHLNTAQLVNIAASLPDHFNVYAELWGDYNYDPSGTVKQYSADTAVAYGVTPHLQLDAGVNVGLNRNTPAIQAYVGVSQKF